MFSYLRAHHRRSGSTPTTPDKTFVDQASFLQPPPHSSHGQTNTQSPSRGESPNFISSAKIFESDSVHSRSASVTPISPLPPTLPPIPRVASVYDSQNEKGASSNAGTYSATNDARERQDVTPRPTDIRGARMERREQYAGSYRPRDEHNGRRNSQEEREHVQPQRPNTASTVTGFRSRGQTAYQPGVASSHETVEAHPGVGLKPMISPPSAAASSELGNISPTQFPSASHRVPPKPPQPSSTSSPSPRPPTANVHIQPRVEKHEKQGKKLNLRNPMSLLLRRRSGQVLEHLSDEALISHRTQAMPGLLRSDDFDPSIRGSIVHDFSAPRSRRNFAAAGATNEALRFGPAFIGSSSSGISREKLQLDDSRRAERQYAPVGRERFEDDEDGERNGSATRAEALPPGQNVAILSSFAPSVKPLPQLPEPTKDSQTEDEAPPDEAPPHEAPPHEAPPEQQPSDMPQCETPLSPVAEDSTSPAETSSPPSAGADRPRTKKTPSSASRSTKSMRASRTSTTFDWQSAGLPPHMLSNSSRFSFQLAGSSAAQERLLEERHKQKEAAKAREQANRRAEEDGSEADEEFYMDALDDGGYDGFEEDIPTVGEEWDDAGRGLGGLGMTGLSLQDIANMALGGNPVGQLEAVPDLPPPAVRGLGIASPLPEPAVTVRGRGVVDDDDTDDLYFDDGEIDDIDLDDDEHFDESVFDDPSHHLYERKPVNPPRISEASAVDNEDAQPTVVPRNSQRALRRSAFGIVPSEPMPQHPDVNASLETISAYHQALALAATKAAADGRFRRQSNVDINDAEIAKSAQSSMPMRPPDEDDVGVPNVSSRPSLVPDDSKHNSQATSGFSPVPDQLDGVGDGFSGKTVGFSLSAAFDDGFGYSSDFDCSDYDSALGDDPIIAAANAEALANDDEGIYGSEFGFYAKPAPSSEAEFFQGGYFGPKEWSEVKRQRSTREPNLTPITERSEYSTRNSYVSLHMADRASVDRGQPSPGLAALARMSPSWDSDSMETLFKLRRAAFGGSQGSLISGANASSPMNSSPVIGKPDTRALWSSPISRELDGEDGIEEEIEPDILDEANYADDDDDDDDIIDLDNVAGDISPRSKYPMPLNGGEEDDDYDDDNDDEQANSDTQEYSIHSESPTIRATLQQPPSIRRSPSPAKQLAFTQNAQTSHSQSMTTASTSLAQNSPLAAQCSPPTSSRPVLRLPLTPVSPAAASSFGPNSPVSPNTTQRHVGHSRSGSDSVAYVKERDDEAGTFRWVLERRRTAEDGGVEIVGREVVSGGRI